jgi:hypothetical protein
MVRHSSVFLPTTGLWFDSQRDYGIRLAGQKERLRRRQTDSLQAEKIRCHLFCNFAVYSGDSAESDSAQEGGLAGTPVSAGGVHPAG